MALTTNKPPDRYAQLETKIRLLEGELDELKEERDAFRHELVYYRERSAKYISLAEERGVALKDLERKVERLQAEALTRVDDAHIAGNVTVSQEPPTQYEAISSVSDTESTPESPIQPLTPTNEVSLQTIQISNEYSPQVEIGPLEMPYTQDNSLKRSRDNESIHEADNPPVKRRRPQVQACQSNSPASQAISLDKDNSTMNPQDNINIKATTRIESSPDSSHRGDRHGGELRTHSHSVSSQKSDEPRIHSRFPKAFQTSADDDQRSSTSSTSHPTAVHKPTPNSKVSHSPAIPSTAIQVAPLTIEPPLPVTRKNTKTAAPISSHRSSRQTPPPSLFNRISEPLPNDVDEPIFGSSQERLENPNLESSSQWQSHSEDWKTNQGAQAHPEALARTNSPSLSPSPSLLKRPIPLPPRPSNPTFKSSTIRRFLGGLTGPGTTFTIAKSGKIHLFLTHDNCPLTILPLPCQPAVVYVGNEIPTMPVTMNLNFLYDHDAGYDDYDSDMVHAGPDVRVFIDRGRSGGSGAAVTGTSGQGRRNSTGSEMTWEYGGEYKSLIKRVDPDEFQMETEKFRQNFVHKLLFEKEFQMNYIKNPQSSRSQNRFRSSVLRDKELKAIESGEKVIFITYLKCYSYDHDFLDNLVHECVEHGLEK